MIAKVTLAFAIALVATLLAGAQGAALLMSIPDDFGVRRQGLRFPIRTPLQSGGAASALQNEHLAVGRAIALARRARPYDWADALAAFAFRMTAGGR